MNSNYKGKKNVLIFGCIFLFGFLLSYKKDKEMNYLGRVGTIRVATYYKGGFVLATDGKASIKTRKSSIRIKILDKRVLYHQKLFKIGKNLVAAYGCQVHLQVLHVEGDSAVRV